MTTVTAGHDDEPVATHPHAIPDTRVGPVGEPSSAAMRVPVTVVIPAIEPAAEGEPPVVPGT